MKKNSLSSKGLSLSQAQSISNLCNQRSRDISAKLDGVNNASKTLVVEGKNYTSTQGISLPENTGEMLVEKAKLHATQAFLMENIKAKDALLLSKQWEDFNDQSTNPSPIREDLDVADLIPTVTEDWGWEQLTVEEYNEYLEAEAYASHIGQFIHKGGTLDKLRKELPTIKTLEWMEVEVGKKTPVNVTPHHTPEQLADLHEELAASHRKHEQKVNYFKAKVKDLTTKENARISKVNKVAQEVVNEKNQLILDKFSKSREEWLAGYRKASQEFEEKRQKEISEIAALRINVPSRFQPVIDMFLGTLE